MTYTKTTFADGSGGGTPITAAELNKIGTGIEAAVLKAGDTMTGDITLGTHKVTAAGTSAGTSAGNIASDTNSLNFLKVTPTEAAADPFFFWQNQADVGTQARNDQIVLFGWNLNAGGGLVNSGTRRGGLGMSMEQYFEQTPGDTATAQMEMHWFFVTPAGVQNRPISFLGQLNAPYGGRLYLNAEQINMGSGTDNNAPFSLGISPTETSIKSPSAHFAATFDDSGLATTIQAGDAGGTKAQLVLNGAGGLNLTTSGTGRLQGAGGSYAAVEWDSSSLLLKSPDGQQYISVSDNGTYTYAGGALKMVVQSAQVYTLARMIPISDVTLSIGDEGKRYGFAAFAQPVGSLSSPNSDKEGFLTVAQTASGVRSALQVVVKDTANSYAWQKVKLEVHTSTSADPTTTEYPTSGDWGVHKNTGSGAVSLAYNDGGTIKKVALT